MTISRRVKAATRAALIHFLISFVLIVGLVAYVLLAWFPDGLHLLTGGLGLFFVLVVVDLVCGPGLTMILYDPDKSKLKWRIDIALIVTIQIAALSYGVVQISKTRPIFLAFEGDRFRVVQVLDIDLSRISEAPIALQSFSLTGPRPLGVRLAESNDRDYLSSVQESIRGFHPAFRPSRWLPYDAQVGQIRSVAKPLSALEVNDLNSKTILDEGINSTGLDRGRLGYLPLVRDFTTDWIVLIDLQTAYPVGWLPIDGW